MAGAAVATMRRYLNRHRGKVVHGARMTAALVYVLGLSEGLWAVIAAIVVTQSSRGIAPGGLPTSWSDLYSAPFTAFSGCVSRQRDHLRVLDLRETSATLSLLDALALDTWLRPWPPIR